ncbi:beta-1,3-galactosyl-O-glycosyl-glycoprotein beta-1,6-N-acetylglucosaminyltransferase-like [Haliotis asinina]|uniref:beta-1,3-galactosyl-O-glycosyl-glycoprotein beta-1,6-N-acetylglucosaminyltransferase-like n=1 Tax=Haliotis asinina TaxID=109174 RepID=UPI003531E9E7
MAARSAILKSSPVFKYLVPCLFISLFGLLYYVVVYAKLDLTVLVPAKSAFEKLQFIASGYTFSNQSLHLYGAYVSKDGRVTSHNETFITLDGDVLEGIRSRYIHAKQIEFERMCPRIHVTSVSCNALFDGDVVETERVKAVMAKQTRQQKPAELYIELTQNCDTFKRKRGYITKTLTKEEEHFPLAFTLLMFKDVEQVDRLLRAVYRPQNYYCVHVDSKAEAKVKDAMRGIVGCFDNVFFSSRSVDVQWGTYSVLEPEIICMEELWKYKKWKYFINLTGQEFPLKTNFELVRILKVYNGANDLEGTVQRANRGRFEKAGDPPHGITPVKGSVHIVVNRGFVDYVLHNKTAQDFLAWVKNVDVPDETFFTSLNHNAHLRVPGAYLGDPETDRLIKPFLARFKNWGNEPFDWPCEGQRVRLICIFGIGDLPLLRSRPELFTNKFYWDYQPYALDCMEELHYNRTRDEYLGLRHFDDSYYKTLSFVKNKVPL